MIRRPRLSFRIRVRDATTLLEMMVVGVLLMALISTISSFATYLPHWFGRTGNRVDVVREQNVTAGFLEKEMNRAKNCSCPNASELIVTSATTSTPWSYTIVEDPLVPGRYELRRSSDGVNYVRVTGPLSGFTCTERPSFNGVDVCLVWEKEGSFRKSEVHWRRSTQRVMEVQLADLNRDGLNDVVTVRPQQTFVSISTGTNTGTFNVTTSANLNAASEPRSVAIGDYDRNGKLDLAVLTAADIQILEADPSLVTNPRLNGICSYNVTTTIDLDSGGSHSIASGDLDRDGILDLVVSDFAARNVSVHYGIGNMRFQAISHFPIPPLQLTGEARRIKLADMNRDGLLDLVVGLGSHTGGCVVVATGTGVRATMFNAAVPFSGGTESWDISIGDLNRDGILDVVSADWRSDRVAFLQGQASGALLLPGTFTSTVSPTAVGFLNYNTDTIPDIAVIKRLRGTDSELNVFPGTATPGFGTSISTVAFPTGPPPDELDGISVATGNVTRDTRDDWVGAYMTPDPGGFRNANAPFVQLAGGFAATTQTGASVNTKPFYLVAADFNRDGFTDIAMTCNGSSNLATYLHVSGATPYLTKVSLTAQTNPVGIVAADMDRDGDIDLLVANEGSNSVSFFRNNGSGVFSAAVNSTSLTPQLMITSPRGLAVGDFDRDGDPDLIVVGNTNTNNLRVYNFDATTGLLSPMKPAVTSLNTPADVRVADLNKDGRLDAVVCHEITGVTSPLTANVRVFWGLGDGTFPNTFSYNLGNQPIRLALADFNNDGALDITTANSNINEVGVMLGQMGALAGQMIGGAPTILSAFPVGTGGTKQCRDVVAADWNRDGNMDILAVGFNGNNPRDGFLAWARGTGTGTFSGWLDAVEPNAGNNDRPYGLVVFDENRDGKPDVVTTLSNTNEFNLRRGP